MKLKLILTLSFFSLGSLQAATVAKPLKVFILVGQSNMEGHARIETFDYLCDDPATAPLLRQMRNPDGTPRVCEHVWISYLTGSGENNGEGFGRLTAGYPEWACQPVQAENPFNFPSNAGECSRQARPAPDREFHPGPDRESESQKHAGRVHQRRCFGA